MPCTKQAHCIKDSDVENISIGDATGGFKLSDTKRCFRSYPMIKKNSGLQGSGVNSAESLLAVQRCTDNDQAFVV